MTLQNTSSSNTLTYVELTITQALNLDEVLKYSKQQQAIPTTPQDDGRWTKNYYYKLFLKPGKEIRLMFPEPPTDRFYSKITNALGREAKWTDAVSTTSLSNTIKPEPRDPLE